MYRERSYSSDEPATTDIRLRHVPGEEEEDEEEEEDDRKEEDDDEGTDDGYSE
jgi:hypothetical protein